MTPLDLSIKGAIEEFDQGAAVNPIQQAIEVLQELHDEGEISPQKLNPVLTSLRSLQKEAEGAGLPEPDLYTWGATNPNAYSQSAVRTAVAAALGRGAMPHITPAQAMDALKEAFVADPSYAWTWHCGVWAAAHDEGMETSAANRAAARLMSMAFDVDTSKHENFAATQAAAPSPEGTQPTQAEAPSEREAREMQEVADKLREAGYHSAANNTERTIADIKSGNMPRAVIGAALATQQAAFTKADMNAEYVRGRADGWNAACVAEPPRRQQAVQAEPASSIDFWQRRGYLGEPSEWREACRLFRVRCNEHDIAAMAKLRTYIEDGLLEVKRAATPPAPGQVERINLSTFAWGVTRMGDNPKAVLVSFRSEPTDDDLRALHEALRPASGRTVHANAAQAGQVERDREDAERYRALREADPDSGVAPMLHECDDWGRWYWLPMLGAQLDKAVDAIRAARSSEGGVV